MPWILKLALNEKKPFHWKDANAWQNDIVLSKTIQKIKAQQIVFFFTNPSASIYAASATEHAPNTT